MLETFVNETSGEWTGSSLYHRIVRVSRRDRRGGEMTFSSLSLSPPPFSLPIFLSPFLFFRLSRGSGDIKPHTSSAPDQRNDLPDVFSARARTRGHARQREPHEGRDRSRSSTGYPGDSVGREGTGISRSSDYDIPRRAPLSPLI